MLGLRLERRLVMVPVDCPSKCLELVGGCWSAERDTFHCRLLVRVVCSGVCSTNYMRVQTARKLGMRKLDAFSGGK